MGDLNSDKHTDLFVLNLANATDAITPTWVVEAWLWNADAKEFRICSTASIVSTRTVTGVVASDFNYDGKLDLLLSGPTYDSWSREVTFLSLHFGALTSFESEALELPSSLDPVLVADVNNDLRPDLFGARYTYDESNPAPSSAGADANLTATHRAYWLNTAKDGVLSSFQMVAQPLDQAFSAYPIRTTGINHTAPLPTLASPHSHAFVDLNGDCMADLVVTSTGTLTDDTTLTFLEIWLNRAELGPVFHSISALPSGAGQIAFEDIDNDGNIDILVPVFSGEDTANEIHLYYNAAKQLCRSAYSDSDNCRAQSALCSADDNFYFDFMKYTLDSQEVPTDSANLVVYRFPTGMIGGHMYNPYSSTLGQSNPATNAPFQLRLGDINLDGYPDLLLALTPTPAEAVEYGVAELWLNVAATTSAGTPQAHAESVLCASAAEDVGRRVFSSTASGLDTANNLLSAQSGAFAGAAFFDLADDGDIDVLFSTRAPAGTSGAGTFTTHVFENDLDEDAYFLTSQASNGVCPAWCDVEPTFPDPKPYGVNVVGATFKFAYTDLSGTRRASIGATLTRSAYMPLAPPYRTFGLGRTNTFIDTFSFGVGLNQSVHSRSWVSMVPNAQVMVFPYPPSDPAEWTMELFISPSSHLLWVGVSWAATLTLIAIVIGALHIREKREDAQEKSKHQLLFTF